ncbi:MAG: tRNA (guanosine(46)-N7)-methyltransferase TrmB [Candidatus Dehalobacter alkaniphilus]|nr:tRNA (guanosine(46)-N7)-methyltransferase TrmB [Dehalobacter sp.]
MRLRRKRSAKLELEKDTKTILAPAECKGKWNEVFDNNDPVHLELGCGRGDFIASLAGKTENINYIAIDSYPEVLVCVLRKLNQSKLPNVRLVSMRIEDTDSIFGQDEIDKIYINFCNPWPSKRHHKRRLTHPNFLRKYQTFVKKGSEVWFKTDDEPLFEDSLQYFQETGFQELYRTYDLHQSGFEENIMTEYETKFTGQGIKIKFAVFKYE